MYGITQQYITKLFYGNRTYKLLALQMTRKSTPKEVTYLTTIQSPSKTLQASFVVTNKDKEKYDEKYPFNIMFNFGEFSVSMSNESETEKFFTFLGLLSDSREGGANLQNKAKEIYDSIIDFPPVVQEDEIKGEVILTSIVDEVNVEGSKIVEESSDKKSTGKKK